MTTAMTEKRIYFVGEASINGRTVQTERIDKIIDAETEKPIYEDAFQITKYADVENYKNKDDFIMNLLSTAYFILKVEGEIEGVVILNALEEGTDIVNGVSEWKLWIMKSFNMRRSIVKQKTK